MGNVSPTAAHPAGFELSGAEIHTSDVMAYQQCRYAWMHSSRLGMNLERKKLYAPFFLGRMIHNGLERYYADGTSFDVSVPEFVETETASLRKQMTLWAEEQALIQEQTELGAGMLRHYLAWEKRQSGPFAMANMQWLTVEQEFAVPIVHPSTGEIMPDAFFAGKMDGILQDAEGGLWINEWKTARSIDQRAKSLDIDVQATWYTMAARQIFGDAIKGLVYTIMAKRVPPFPKVNQNGTLSKVIKDQSLDSYLEAIYAHHGRDVSKGYIGSEYGAKILELASNPSGYFERFVVTRTDAALQNGAIHLWDVSQEMVKSDTPLFRTPGHHCNYCLFLEPCRAALNGEDTTEMLANNYQNRVYDDVGEGTE